MFHLLIEVRFLSFYGIQHNGHNNLRKKLYILRMCEVPQGQKEKPLRDSIFQVKKILDFESGKNNLTPIG